ncbi:hypothetical protein WA158_001982 [Blastocystis sp. Blastoise]
MQHYMPNLTGTWKLDVNKSDSVLSYLLSLGVPELAAQASSKLADIICIDQTSDVMNITRMSRYGKDIKHLKFGEEISVKSVMGGNHKIICAAYPDCIKTTTTFAQNRGHLVDTRRLEDGGRCMHTTLQYITADGKEITYNRFFTKSAYTAEELIAQSEDIGRIKSPKEDDFESDE